MPDQEPTDPDAPTEIDGAAAYQMGADAQTTGGGLGWQAPEPEELDPLFPDYEIQKLLGRGGMGAVYKGVQTKLKRPVAIKLLPPEMAALDPSFAERFRREAESMAALDHPNIVHVYDFGETSAGHSYFVMEFVDGMDFHQLIHSGQLDAMGALNAVSQICDALEYAHEQGFVHRDIKPANIFINQKGILKVGDFGLAKIASSATTEVKAAQPTLTMIGTAMGTPDYSAPEQLDGGEVDQRADIYSLGVMFYEMLTGSVPRGIFPPPSQKVQIDVRLDGVVLKAMESEPERRYSNVTEMRTDVDAVRTGPAEEIPEPTPPPPSPERQTKTPVVAIFGIVLGVCALVAGGWFAFQNGATSDPAVADPTALSASVANATRENPFENSLGMRFIPVPIAGGPTGGQRVLFSIWETRVSDFQAFMSARPGRPWLDHEFEQADDHPAVRIQWQDAVDFCEWLTEEERQKGNLGPNQRYRLPTDHEWSCAAGIGQLEDAEALPSEKNEGIPDLYFWGREWPPPSGVGNLYGEETIANPEITKSGPKRPIEGYRDSFARTAPVGSFPANEFGLYDICGNTGEWCQDWYSESEEKRVARGSSWSNIEKWLLQTSNRNSFAPAIRFETLGFRLVLETETASTVANVASLPETASLPPDDVQVLIPTKETHRGVEYSCWRGELIEFQLVKEDWDPEMMTRLVANFDAIHQTAIELTGFDFSGPSLDRVIIREEPRMVSMVGPVGQDGILQVGSEDLDRRIQRFADGDGMPARTIDLTLGWLLDQLIPILGYPETHNVVQNRLALQGIITALKFACCDQNGIELDAVANRENLRRRNDDVLAKYEAWKEVSWLDISDGGTINGKLGQIPISILGSAFFNEIERNHGQADFLRRFLQEEVFKLERATTNQQSIDNFYLAASRAAQTNLDEFLIDRLRWPVSEAARAEFSQQ